MFVVYKITNLISGKIYIGQTKQKIEERLLQHKYSFSPLVFASWFGHKKIWFRKF